MSFSPTIRDEVFTKSARHCSVCHRFKGLNLEIHHIVPKNDSGQDTFDNAICLCFDCHADAGHYFAGHPKGSRVTPNELIRQRDEWYLIVQEHKIQAPRLAPVEVSVLNEGFDGVFYPCFIKETTVFFDWNFYKETYELLGMNVTDVIENMKKDQINPHSVVKLHVNKITDYDSYISFLNGDWIKRHKGTGVNCQPVRHHAGAFRFQKEINEAACVLQLQLTNIGLSVLEDYKLNLHFEKVEAADTVSKHTEALDLREYSYNVQFLDNCHAEFWPERSVLVQRDSVRLDTICFIPNYRTRYVRVHWEMLARDAFYSGVVTVLIKPSYEQKHQTRFVMDQPEPRRETRYLPKTFID
jgi:hypothetical protein